MRGSTRERFLSEKCSMPCDGKKGGRDEKSRRERRRRENGRGRTDSDEAGGTGHSEVMLSRTELCRLELSLGRVFWMTNDEELMRKVTEELV